MKKVLLVCAMGAFLFSCGKDTCGCLEERRGSFERNEGFKPVQMLTN